MLNYWWVSRPKRKLNSIPEVLSTFAEISLDQEWQGQRDTHLSLEEALECAGLKRKGERRDHTGGGGRTYNAWVKSLGLIFEQEATKKIKLTLAGEAIMNGKSPVSVLTAQILKYQFPSPFSISVGVSERFKIRPFRFLLRLLNDDRIAYLSEEEIAKIVIVEAEKENKNCFEYIIKRIETFRSDGDECLEKDFKSKYASSRGINNNDPYRHLLDTANTLINWLEYTQLVRRNEDGKLKILSERKQDVENILKNTPNFIDRPQEEEFFQRKYGVDPEHEKDTRNLTNERNITPEIIAIQKIKNAFLSESLKSPIHEITSIVIDKIIELTGISKELVESTLQRLYPHGAIGSFMAEYYEMAFNGQKSAIDFEKATASIFHNLFGFETQHIGSIRLTPDVLLISNSDKYQAIIDNKAYSNYSISNDHHNRMVQNYIKGIKRYSRSQFDLAFFTYIAGGFCKDISGQIQKISDKTNIKGSAISVSCIIKMIEKNQSKAYKHSDIRSIFSKNTQIGLQDI